MTLWRVTQQPEETEREEGYPIFRSHQQGRLNIPSSLLINVSCTCLRSRIDFQRFIRWKVVYMDCFQIWRAQAKSLVKFRRNLILFTMPTGNAKPKIMMRLSMTNNFECPVWMAGKPRYLLAPTWKGLIRYLTAMNHWLYSGFDTVFLPTKPPLYEPQELLTSRLQVAKIPPLQLQTTALKTGAIREALLRHRF